MFILFTSQSLAENQQLCNAWLELAATTFGYPNKAGTNAYSKPIYHPNGIFLALPILAATIQTIENDPNNQQRILKELGEPQLATVLSADWYPSGRGSI